MKSETFGQGISQYLSRLTFHAEKKGGRPVSTGVLKSLSHVELSGSRKSSGKMQLPIKNWHSRLKP